jgi:hypothetical protein
MRDGDVTGSGIPHVALHQSAIVAAAIWASLHAVPRVTH